MISTAFGETRVPAGRQAPELIPAVVVRPRGSLSTLIVVSQPYENARKGLARLLVGYTPTDAGWFLDRGGAG
jgi:hypothetical protein